MRKKGYILIAEVLKTSLHKISRVEPLVGKAVCLIAKASVDAVAQIFCDDLSKENPRFDKKEFLSAIYGEDLGKTFPEIK